MGAVISPPRRGGPKGRGGFRCVSCGSLGGGAFNQGRQGRHGFFVAALAFALGFFVALLGVAFRSFPLALGFFVPALGCFVPALGVFPLAGKIGHDGLVAALVVLALTLDFFPLALDFFPARAGSLPAGWQWWP